MSERERERQRERERDRRICILINRKIIRYPDGR